MYCFILSFIHSDLSKSVDGSSHSDVQVSSLVVPPLHWPLSYSHSHHPESHDSSLYVFMHALCVCVCVCAHGYTYIARAHNTPL